MSYLCPHSCEGKTEYGYCRYTWCVNPLHSNLGTAYQGQGVQRVIITNGDRVRAMSDEELAEWLDRLITHCYDGPCFNCFMQEACLTSMLDWLKQEANDVN